VIAECGRGQVTSDMQRHSALIPVIVALIIAVVGQGIVLFGDFGWGSLPHGSDMISAAAVTRAGAIEIPAGP
jgi:hypothetical protein